MQIQVNSDRHVEARDALAAEVSSVVERKLSRFSSDLTRVEVHLSDQNSGDKGGDEDMRCVMEARIEGRRPLAATHHAPTIAQAVDGAADKLHRLVASTLGKLRDHRARAGKPPPPDPDASD